jgi:molybdate transport system ATP-binding protein
MQCLIELSGAAVTRGSARLLGPVSWKLMRGRHAAVIGENGSGKTTLLRLLRGEILPDAASQGEPVRTYDFGDGPQASPLGLRQRIGLVSADMQDFYFLHARHTPGRALILAGFFDTPLLYDEPTAEQRDMAEAVIAELGIAAIADRQVGTLSTGQVRMLLIARALVGGPDVLLLDESLEGLDAASRTEVLALLNAASARSTLVCVAHRAGDVPECVTHFSILDHGILVADGPREEAMAVLGDTAPGLAACNTATAALLPYASGAEGHAYLLRMTHVSVVQDATRILDDVSWEVLPGQCWAVVGENGAGKSTLLRLVTSELAPYADDHGTGTIQRLGGMTMDEARPRIGVVSPALQASYARELGWEVTALETVLSGYRGSVGMLDEATDGELLGAREWLARVGLSGLEERPLRRMSYGQQRRVFLARAMAAEPALLLLDEPLTGLDAPSRALMRDMIQRLAEAGLSFVMVTHHAEDMVGSVSHVLALRGGRTTFCGTRGDYEAAGAEISVQGVAKGDAPR